MGESEHLSENTGPVLLLLTAIAVLIVVMVATFMLIGPVSERAGEELSVRERAMTEGVLRRL